MPRVAARLLPILVAAVASAFSATAQPLGFPVLDARRPGHAAPPTRLLTPVPVAAVGAHGTAGSHLAPPFTAVVAGDQPEGDDVMAIAITPSGDRVLTANGSTKNVTVIDAATGTVLADVPVGDRPFHVAANDELAVVSCLDSEEVFVIDLATHAITAVISVPGGPAHVAIHPNGVHATAGIAGTSTGGALLDLEAGTVVAELVDFPFGVVEISGTAPHNRQAYRLTNFAVTPDGATLIAAGPERIALYDAATGAAVGSIEPQTVALWMEIASDGRTLVYGGFTGFARYDLLTHQHLDSLSVGGLDVSGAFATSHDGGEILFASYPAGGGLVAPTLAHFADGSVVRLLHGVLGGGWVDTSVSGRYAAYGGATGVMVYDFDADVVAGEVRDRVWGRHGALAGDGSRLVSVSIQQGESARLYAFSGDELTLEEVQVAGAPVEGDCPLVLAPVPGSPEVVVGLYLSANLGVFDTRTQAFTRYAEAGDFVRGVSVYPSGTHALVAALGFDVPDDAVRLVNLESGAIVDELTLPGAVLVAATRGPFSFVGSIDGGLVVVRRDGGELSVERTEHGVVPVRLAVHPEGTLVMAALAGTNEVAFFSGTTGAEVARAPMSPPGEIAFSADGQHAVVLGTDTFTVFAVTGETVAQLGTFPTLANPVAIAVANGRVAVGRRNFVLTYDSATGAPLDTTAVGTASQWVGRVDLTDDGRVIAFIPPSNGDLFDRVYAGGEVFEAPFVPISPFNLYVDFAYVRTTGAVLVVRPGPDVVHTATVAPTSAEAPPGGALALEVRVIPNPTGVATRISVRGAEGPVVIVVSDLLGREVARVEGVAGPDGAFDAAWPGSDRVAPGTYVARADAGGRRAAAPVTVTR